MSEKTELELLKDRAKMLNISFSNNIGVDALKEKINAELQPKEEKEISADKRARMALNAKRKKAKEEAEKLVRIRITCMNPGKKEWPGEIITVGNKFSGMHKKFISFYWCR